MTSGRPRDDVRPLRQGRKRVRDRDAAATGIEQVEIVLGITDADDILRLDL